jgi:hypothetical protein
MSGLVRATLLTFNQRVVGSIPTALTNYVIDIFSLLQSDRRVEAWFNRRGDHAETHPFMNDSPRMTPASASLLSPNDSLRESHEVFALRFVRLGS